MSGERACEAFRERLVEAAYGEPAGRAVDDLETHLAACEPCRAERESLRAVRQAVRRALAAPAHQPAGAVLVMPRATHRAPRWLSLAAAAALLALVAVALSRAEVAVGPGGASLSFRLLGEGAARPAEGDANSALVLAALRDLRQRETQSRDALPHVLAQELDRRALAVRESQDAALARLVDEIDRRRAQDLGFVLNRMGSLETRTGAEMARTQQLLQFAVLRQEGATDKVR